VIFLICKNNTKNRGENASVFIFYSLTKGIQYDMMVIHTVIVCPFMGIRSNMVILPQMGAAVKGKVMQK